MLFHLLLNHFLEHGGGISNYDFIFVELEILEIQTTVFCGIEIADKGPLRWWMFYCYGLMQSCKI